MATILVVLLSITGLYFTIRTKGAQFTMVGEMFRLLGKPKTSRETAAQKKVSSLQAFFVSLASRVGTGNLAFLTRGGRWTKPVMLGYRLVLGVLIFLGSLMTVDLVWALVDFFMVIMTVCNLIAILLLGKWALRLLEDYRAQRKAGLDPVYKASTCPEIADETECWK